MARANGHPDDCGCCQGLGSRTPLATANLPAQPAIGYRIGTHGRFKASMLAALSDADAPALAALGTRDDDDFSIAFVDAAAAVLDVLTFYQERYANESYLRTACERLSVLEMARLIGYELAPGVAASTHLVFAFQATPGIPPSPDPVPVPVGTKVQSTPAPGELPRTFETTGALDARATWGGLRAQLTLPWHPSLGDRHMYLAGVDNNVEPGDVVLIVGRHRATHPGSERWDVRALSAVETDRDNDRTRLSWDDPLGHLTPIIFPAEDAVQVFVFRQRAALFGHNAPDPRLLSGKDNSLNLLIDNPGTVNAQWKGYAISGGVIDLDAAYAKVLAGSWMVLLSNESGYGSPSLPGYAELYRLERVATLSQRKFGISGKLTRVTPDTEENLGRFGLTDTLVLAQSVELPVAAVPVLHPVFGHALALDTHVEDLVPGQALAIAGKAQRLRVAPGVKGLSLALDGGATPLAEGDSLVMVSAPERIVAGVAETLEPAAFGDAIGRASVTLRLRLRDRDGATGTLVAKGSEVLLDAPLDDDPAISEVAAIADRSDAVTDTRDRTELELAAALAGVYDRASVRVTFNVAPATDGETVEEILGSGDAGKPDQRFDLRQSPLTYVSADTASGRRSTLEVRVNDLLWEERPMLYGAAPDARAYTVQTFDGGAAAVVFGDGVEGGRLPSGQTNVRARYRKGLGVAGNLPTGTIGTLLTRPLGIDSASNPEPASGGEDPESLADARENAPLTVLTLERAVSVKDYRDFARAYAGVAKAHALWVPAGPARGVFLTVAGIDGAALPESGKTHQNLSASLRRYGDALMPTTISSYRPATFTVAMTVKVDESFEPEPVLAEVEATLRSAFSFAARDFGENVSRDEVIAVAHRVDGVLAVHVTEFYKVLPGATPSVATIVQAELPAVSLTEAPVAAELLTLDPGPIAVEQMA